MDWQDAFDEPSFELQDGLPPMIEMAEAQAQEQLDRLMARAAKGAIDLGNARVRAREFADLGLRCGPAIIKDGKMWCKARHRTPEGGLRSFGEFAVPDVMTGVLVYDAKDGQYRYSCFEDEGEREKLLLQTRRLMSEMDRQALERFALRMVGRVNWISARENTLRREDLAATETAE